MCAILPGIPTPSGVPITLQTFAVILAGLVLGWRRGGLAALLYVVLGLAGLPIFSGGVGGVAVLAGPSVGYLLAFPFAAALAGVLAGWALRAAERLRSSSLADRLAARFGDGVGRAPSAWRYPLLVVAGLGASFLTIHPAGIVGLMVRLGITLPEAFAIDVVYWTGRRAEEPRRCRGRRRGLQGVPRHAALAPLTSMIALDDVLVTAYSPDPAGGADRVVRLLGPVTLELVEHRVAIVGANGSGKSTLARLLNGLVLPSSGTVRVDGLDTARDGAAVRRKVGFMFTDPDAQLVMPTPVEDVALSLRRLPMTPAERDVAARAALARFGLADRAEVPVHALSGGQRQLLALASVLATEPAILVCDEPTTLLDLRWRGVVDALLADLDQQVVVVTHDLDAALQADRVLVVDDGSVVFDGDPAEAVAHYRALMQVGA